jgi:hypothetical protein
MDSQFAKLCDLLDDEAERQETLLALLQSQRHAIQQRDLSHLEAKSAAMRGLIQDSADAQTQRHQLLRELVDELTLSTEDQTLTELIKRAPEPLARRLGECQQRLRGVMAESKAVVRDNSRSLSRSLSIANRCLDAVQGRTTERPAYNRAGQERRPDGSAALLNQQG